MSSSAHHELCRNTVQAKAGMDDYHTRLASLMDLFDRMLDAEQLPSKKLVRITILGMFAVSNALWVPDGNDVEMGTFFFVLMCTYPVFR
jgi:hypothetical protein